MRAVTVILVLATLAVSATPVQAHASPDPLDVEIHLIDDDIDDSYSQYDGFDIDDVYVREAYIPTAGTGLVFRVFLYGGFAEAPVASSLPLELDVTAGGTVHTLSAQTTDGTVWTGDSIVEQEFEDEDGQSQGYLQLFIPYSDLGVAIGDSVGPFEVRTFADNDLRDIAPGGRPAPGSQGQVITPADDEVINDGITLGGPIGYTNSTVTVTDQEVEVFVDNLITATGQHVTFTMDAPSGWTVADPDPTAVSIQPGQNQRFSFPATAEPGSADATITIHTDLGGLETLTLTADNVPSPASDDSEEGPQGEDEGQESPVGSFLAVLAIVLVAIIRRR